MESWIVWTGAAGRQPCRSVFSPEEGERAGKKSEAASRMEMRARQAPGAQGQNKSGTARKRSRSLPAGTEGSVLLPVVVDVLDVVGQRTCPLENNFNFL